MPHTSRERYAVVSCHVERPLDAALWGRFAAIQSARPSGFVIAALMRPADPASGEEDDAVWLARAREAEARSPLGHHPHWTAPDHARPSGEGAGARVLSEGLRLKQRGLAPTLFCGGGWYTDVEVAEACAELGYVDCTARPTRPPYLPPGERWASLTGPATVELPSGRELLAIPTTHSLGDLLRACTRRDLPDVVHVYFHDTDLLHARRRAMLHAGLAVLAKRSRPTDLDALAACGLPDLPRVAWDDVARL